MCSEWHCTGRKQDKVCDLNSQTVSIFRPLYDIVEKLDAPDLTVTDSSGRGQVTDQCFFFCLCTCWVKNDLTNRHQK